MPAENTDVQLSEDGQATLDAILARRARLIQPHWREKILHVLALEMDRRGVSVADKPLVLEAAKFVTSAGFTPYFDRIENVNRFRDTRAWKYEREAYYAAPREIRRWPSTATGLDKDPTQVKVLAVSASPRRDGNTEVIMQAAMRALTDLGASAEMLRLQKLKINYCIGCRKCKQPGYEKLCSIDDDMTAVYDQIQACDLMIVGFPIYTGRESAQLSVFFDRLDCFRRFDAHEDRFTATRLLKPGRRALVVGTWGYTNVTTYDHVVEKIATLLNGHRIEPVEALSASGFAGLKRGFDDNGKAIIRHYPEELKKAYAAGRALLLGSET